MMRVVMGTRHEAAPSRGGPHKTEARATSCRNCSLLYEQYHKRNNLMNLYLQSILRSVILLPMLTKILTESSANFVGER